MAGEVSDVRSLNDENMVTDVVNDSVDLVSKEEGHIPMPTVTNSEDLVGKEEGHVALLSVPDSEDLVGKEEGHVALLSVPDSEDLVGKEGHVVVPSVADSEDLVSKEEGHVVVSAVTVNESSGEQGDESCREPNVENKRVKLDVEIAEGNYGDRVGEVDVSIEKTVESSLATEKPLGNDVVVEADVDNRSELKAESVIVTEVADEETAEITDVVNKESFGHNVVDNSVEASLRPCSIIAKMSSSFCDLSGQKLADISDTPCIVEASTTKSDVTADHEMNQETPVKGNTQDELPVLAGFDDPLAAAPCTEISVKETHHLLMKQSNYSLNSDEANYFVLNEESQHLNDPRVISISKKDDSFSFDLPNTLEGNINTVSQPSKTPQDSDLSGAVVGSAVTLSSTPKNRKRSQKNSQGPKESPEPKKRRSTVRKSGKKVGQPDEPNLLNKLDGEERPTDTFAPLGSSLSTLNFSSLQPAAFQHSFTDLQQLQLRAQIFVYGSLIQGNAPDEACLISAFGGHDGGRSIWEKPWAKWLERIHNQMPQTIMKSVELQSAGKSDSQTVNHMIPLSSTFWNMHTSSPQGLPVSGVSQAPLVDHNLLPQLYSFQSPAKSTGLVTPWSTHASRPFPQTSSWDPNISLFAFPNTEPVKLVPVKESSLIPYSSANHSFADKTRSNIAEPATSSEIVGEVKVMKSQGQVAKASKARKAKRVSVSNKILESASHSREVALANVSNDIQLAPAKNISHQADNPLIIPDAPRISSDHISVEDMDAGKKEMALEDTLHQVNKAKLHAEEAAACAEAAVSQCQHVWDQYDKQKNSGLTADFESRVASAAVAIAAAASISKAAAAAAKLASEAALQAKLMAEESLISIECIKDGYVDGATLSDGVNLLDTITPASILKGDTSANTSLSIIGAAKEAARKKIESAMYAYKHAQNLDAIVKAAELAAEAVAQAGRVLTMGDPLPFGGALINSGPEGIWKISQQPSEQLAVSNSKEVSPIKESNGGSFSNSKMVQDGNLYSQPSQHTTSENQPAPQISTFEKIDAQTSTADPVSTYVANEDMSANAVVPSELGSEKKSPVSFHQESQNIVDTPLDNHTKEGSVVEVFKQWGSVKAAWFAARVLDKKDDKVCVCYIEKQTGDGEYKEWITLSSENTAPIVRIAHPMTVIPLDGARKRRRSAIGRCCWGVGDKVDAWMQDWISPHNWWEGLIIEKNDKDELSLTVQFPAQGETCVVKAWNLRPSLIWKDGAWVQWSGPNRSIRSRQEDDTPRGKRQRLSSPQIDNNGKDKASESLAGLSEHDKKFNIGKNTKEDVKVNAQRMVRTGLREGSKVIFGVPKPGKKRKFMDVGNSNEPQKTSRVPISRGPHGWKNSSSRTDVQQQTSKSKTKDESVTPSEFDEGREVNHTADSDNVSGTETQAEIESCSVSDGATDDSILISSLARPPTNPSSKSSSLGIMKSKRANSAKVKLTRVETVDNEEDTSIHETTQQEAPDAAVARRSNRRIQPTSRLLEGLQTSLSIAKVASTVNKK